MNFPLTLKTRAGYTAIITGMKNYYDKQLVGVITIEGVNLPASWTDGGHYTSPQIEHAFDISLPE